MYIVIVYSVYYGISVTGREILLVCGLVKLTHTCSSGKLRLYSLIATRTAQVALLVLFRWAGLRG